LCNKFDAAAKNKLSNTSTLQRHINTVASTVIFNTPTPQTHQYSHQHSRQHSHQHRHQHSQLVVDVLSVAVYVDVDVLMLVLMTV
jgi:hypothetical protein